MKKLLALLLAGALALSMSACCCCLPMEDFELPDFDIPDFDLPDMQQPSGENFKPTGNVIIVVPSDPDKDNSDPGNDPSGEIQRPSEPQPPVEVPTVPVAPARKEVFRCVLSTWRQPDFGSGSLRLTLKDGMIYWMTSSNAQQEELYRYVVYDWNARRAYIVIDETTGEVSETIQWDEQGNIIQSDTSDRSVHYSYTTFNEVDTIHVYDTEGTLQTQIVMEYDSENRPVSSITYGQYGQVQERIDQSFNEYGDVLRYTSIRGGYLDCDDVYTYEYDDNGNMVSKSCISAIDGRFVGSEIYTYNDIGLLEYKYSLSEDGSCHHWYEYQYNDAGLQTRENTYYNEGLCYSTVTDYDSNGNVIYTAAYSYYEGNETLLGDHIYEYETVYLTEEEERVQAYVDNLARGWW